MTYTRPALGDPGNSGPTSAVTIVDALSDGLDVLEYRTINVRTYGATGNGSTDDTAAIQAALNAVPADGGIVYFPAGNYSVPNGGLTCSNPVIIEGAGHGSYESGGSRIKVTSRTATALTLGANGSQVRDICLIREMSGATFTTNRATAGAGILVNEAQWFHATRVLVSGFWDCISVTKGHYYNFTDCVILNPANTGIKLTTILTWHDWGVPYITGCTVSKYGDPLDGGTALAWFDGGGIKISNNYFNSATQPNYPSTGRFNKLLDFQIVDGGATSVLTIMGNGIENSYYGGINFTQQGPNYNYAIFNFIRIHGNEIGYTGTHSIAIASPSSDTDSISITGNTMVSADLGVYLSKVEAVTIDNNVFKGMSTAIYTTTCSNLHFGEGNIYLAYEGAPVATYYTAVSSTPQAQNRYSASFTAIKGTWTTLWALRPEQYRAGILKVTLSGEVSSVGSQVAQAVRTVTRETSTAVVATLGTDIQAGAAAGMEFSFDTTTTSGVVYVKARVPSASAGPSYVGVAHLEATGHFLSIGPISAPSS